MNDVLARTTCDLKDDSGRWQNIAKDIENEIPIAQCGKRIPAVVAHSSGRTAGTPTIAATVCDSAPPARRCKSGDRLWSRLCQRRTTDPGKR
jgi:hypothetical protein